MMAPRGLSMKEASLQLRREALIAISICRCDLLVTGERDKQLRYPSATAYGFVDGDHDAGSDDTEDQRHDVELGAEAAHSQ